MKEVYVIARFDATGRNYKTTTDGWSVNPLAARRYDTYSAAEGVINDVGPTFTLGTMFAVQKLYVLS